MFKNYLSLPALAFLISVCGCSSERDPLTIADAEAAGFSKGEQQLFQMINAQDGWSGEWAGDRVELYQFESEAVVDQSVFESSVQEGNLSGWAELCQGNNLLMLSKGEAACRELEALAGS